ncbi:MAG TPA: FAD-dependent oxidoreductase [Candidatus Acidoferrum sp.]|nr:FAD-dependent oxidoreductase [Candidatus Acidoferrum sp.]
MTANQTAVIIGTGLAGGNAAVTLREGGWSGRIVMLGAESGIPFGRPPLSKTYLRGEESLSGWLVKPEDWYADNRVELRAGVRVQGVDTKLKKVTLQGEETVAYDKLLLCTGGKNRRFQVPGAEAPDVYQLRTMAECDAIRRAAQPGARALIVGMGFIGSEVAASLRQLGLEVSAVLSGTAPLTAVLGNQVAEVMARMHRNHGVQLVTDDRVVGFEGSEHLAGAMTAKGARIECDLAVVAIGIDPNVDAVRSSGIALDNGILVDETCRTSAPDVFAAGDVANHLHPVFGRVRVEHYNNAEKQGRAAGRAMLGDQRPYDDIHTFWSDQYEDKLEYVGDGRIWDQVVIRGSLAESRFLAFYLSKGIMKAACGLNRGGDPELDADGELRACLELIRAKAALAEATLADEQVDLRSLAVAAANR